MPDQAIDAVMARALHADACRNDALVAWVVLWDLSIYPEPFAARLASNAPPPLLLLAETLADIREMLPLGLMCSKRQPVDPPDIVEIQLAK